MRRLCLALLALLCLAAPAWAEETERVLDGEGGPALFPELEAGRRALAAEGWLVHGQATFIEQGHPAFHSPYRAGGSLQPKAMQRNTFSADLILGRRLWQGAELVVNPEVIRGFGLTNTRGVAAFPNGEAFRLGSEAPSIFVPRVFLRQTIALGGPMLVTAHHNNDHADYLRFPEPVAANRITLTVGKLSVFDIFDDNRFAHEARRHFLNWAFVGGAAFDFAADAKGFSNGAAAELDWGNWGLRAAAFQVARRLNSLSLDPQPGRAYQLLVQAERYWEIGGHLGAVRVLGGYERMRSQSWNALLADDITNTLQSAPGRYGVKRMAVLNLEQEVADGVGLFARLSWNDGRTQNWMYTEMDRAVSLGVDLEGGHWGAPTDSAGLAANLGGISGAHRRFLAAGGIGILTGDGALRYRHETVVEAYYDRYLGQGVHAALDAQLVVNPAYNADRGPVAVLGARLRANF